MSKQFLQSVIGVFLSLFIGLASAQTTSPPPVQKAANFPPIPAVPPTLGDGTPAGTVFSVVNQERPINPQEIEEIRRFKDRLDKAAAKRPSVAPEPVSSSIKVSLAASQMPVPVRVDNGIVTTLVFVDSTGAPWPIADFAAGDKKSLILPDVQALVQKRMNVLTVSAAEYYISTNLSVLLESASAPLVLPILSGQRRVDYRVDLVVQGMGPNATKLVGDASFSDSLPSEIMNALSGSPNDDAKELTVSGDSDTKVWHLGNKFIVRTRLAIVSPAAIRSGKSIDGTRVFEIPVTPVLLALKNGDFKTIKITGF